jgi:hypothetical protein
LDPDSNHNDCPNSVNPQVDIDRDSIDHYLVDHCDDLDHSYDLSHSVDLDHLDDLDHSLDHDHSVDHDHLDDLDNSVDLDHLGDRDRYIFDTTTMTTNSDDVLVMVVD